MLRRHADKHFASSTRRDDSYPRGRHDDGAHADIGPRWALSPFWHFGQFTPPDAHRFLLNTQ